MLAEHAQKLDSTQRNSNWEGATQSIKEASQRGQLPTEFGKAAELCYRSYQGLSDDERQYIGEVDPDVRVGIFMLATGLVQSQSNAATSQGTGKSDAVRHLIERVAQEAQSS